MYQVQGAVSGTTGIPPSAQTVASGQSSHLQRSPAGDWTVYASGKDDKIQAQETWNGGIKYLSVAVNADSYLIPLIGPNAARSIAIYAGAGNDSVFVDPNVTAPLYINGGAGNDYLKGGSGPNALIGGAGNDILIGGGSNDLLLGSPGCDTVQGNGGRDMHSIADLFARLKEGRSEAVQPPLKPEAQPQPQPVQPQPPPSAPPVTVPPPPVTPPPPPVVVCPPPPSPPQRPPAPVVVPRPPKPKTPPRPPLSTLLANVDTHDEKGFKSGREMTKRLLTSLYAGPGAFQSALSSLSSAGERDDAAASFVRALLESGPGGAQLLKGLSASQKTTLANYLRTGNSWSDHKKGIMVLLSRMTGVMDPGFAQDQDALQHAIRYQGVMV